MQFVPSRKTEGDPMTYGVLHQKFTTTHDMTGQEDGVIEVARLDYWSGKDAANEGLGTKPALLTWLHSDQVSPAGPDSAETIETLEMQSMITLTPTQAAEIEAYLAAIKEFA
jgi:hypothetical protein